VTSAPGATVTARSTRASPSAGTSDGVPPPTNTDVATAPVDAIVASMSAWTASRYSSIRWWRSVQVAKAQ
jgi:hypothetical protein